MDLTFLEPAGTYFAKTIWGSEQLKKSARDLWEISDQQGLEQIFQVSTLILKEVGTRSAFQAIVKMREES